MKISTDLSNAGLSETRSAGTGGSGQSGATQGSGYMSSAGFGSGSSSDHVSLSGVSQLLRSGSAQRTETITSLTSAVRSGSYDVSSSQVGRSMVSELLARSSDR